MAKPPVMSVSFIGQKPSVVAIEDEGDVSDFRQVPSSDRGNESYSDRGQLGSFGPSNREQFRNNPDTVLFDGYGATKDDIDLGFIRPGISEDPAYDKANYIGRSSEPKRSDEDFGNTNSLDRDYEFRSRNRESRGFLNRPRFPTERG